MHRSNFSVPLFITRVRGTRIVVTPDIVSDVLCVPRLEHSDYLGCDRLKTVSKDELFSSFCEHPSDWGEHQFTYYSCFAKGPHFLNIIINFVLHSLSHYNSITKPRAWFLLSLLKHLSIDFLFHFILFIIDVHRDTVTHDKLIFPSAITRILCHFSVPFPLSNHFSIMGAIDATTIKQSKAQFRSKWPGLAAPPTPSAPYTSTPFSSTSGVTFEDIMAQLQRMNARLDTLSDKLCQVNTRVGRIVRRQAVMGGFVTSPPPTPEAFEDEDDGDASSSNADEMST